MQQATGTDNLGGGCRANMAMFPRSYRVSTREQLTSDTASITVQPISDATPACQPGQFFMLYVFGVGEVPISASGTGARGELTFTIRDVGPVTKKLCELGKGEFLGVRGPFGSGWPLAQCFSGDLLILAGGVGLAPLRMLIEAAAQRRGGGSARLLYGARSPADMLFESQLRGWSRAGLEVQVTVDLAPAGWSGSVGLITELLSRVALDSPNTTAAMCGPEIMMKLCASALARRGVPANRMFLAMERNMKCGVGLCGHCQFGPEFICKDGPVHSYETLAPFLSVSEV